MSITITATASNKDAVVSAFEKLGWTSMSTTKEISNYNRWELYFSLKKGKRSLRISFWWSRGVKYINDNLDNGVSNCVRKIKGDIPSLELDISSIDAHYAKLDLNYVKMVEGRNQFKFKKQLITPYVEGLLMEKGFVRISTQQNTNKSSITNFSLSDNKKTHCSLYLKPLKYAELSEADYDDMLFDLTMPNLFLTGKLSYLIKVAEYYFEVDRSISLEIQEHKKKLIESEKQISDLNKLCVDIKNIICNKRNSILKRITKKIEDSKNGNSNTTLE